MDKKTFLHIKSAVLLVGVLVYLIYSCFVLYVIEINVIKLCIQLAPALIGLISAYMIDRSSGKSELDDWLLYFSFSTAGICTGLTLFINGQTDYSEYLMIIIILGIAEISFYRSERIANLQFFTALGIGVVFFLFSNDTMTHKAIILGLLSTLLTWKYANSFYFKDYSLRHSEELKLHTYRSTVATLNHELNNTTMIILGFAEKFRKKEDPEILNRIEFSLKRMSTQIKKLENMDEVEFIDYLGDSEHQTIKLKA